MPQENDRALIRRCIAGEETAWRELVERTYPAASGAVRWYFRQKGIGIAPLEEEELLYGLYFRLWEEDQRLLRNFRGDCSPVTWICALARTEAKGWLRKRAQESARLQAFRQEAQGEEPAAPPGDPSLEREESLGKLERALASLSPEDRRVLARVYREGRTYRQIAEELGTSHSAITRHVARIKQRLLSLFPEGLFCL